MSRAKIFDCNYKLKNEVMWTCNCGNWKFNEIIQD